MKWLPWIGSRGEEGPDEALRRVQERFESFLVLLEANNRVLRLIGDLEERAFGDVSLDPDNMRSSVAEIRAGVVEIIDSMVALGGRQYEELRRRFSEIDGEIESILTGSRSIEPDRFTVPLGELAREQRGNVGSKNAQLGEMKTKLGLPVPDGFAITAWAYKHFLEANDLQKRITERIESVDIRRYEDLVRVSEGIRDLVLSGRVPEDLSEAIYHSFVDLKNRSAAKGFALRSSAIGEDTHFSFAGQYATFLNVRGEELIDRYLEVLASKFTPKAIYYVLSQSFRETELAMSVGCISMVDAVASGVVYTRDPVRPEQDCMLVNSIYGLGVFLVDGTLTPDVFRITRDGNRVLESHPVRKPVRLVMHGGSGTASEPVPEGDQKKPSIAPKHLKVLANMALRLEEHHGEPQDVEWALDRNGEIYLLQSRPLRVIRSPSASDPDVSGLQVAVSGGVTVFPGAASGPVHVASSTEDLPKVPAGCVLVATRPFPGLVAALGKVAGLVTEIGGAASHLAALAREYRIPAVMGMEGATRLPSGKRVTLDATGTTVFDGEVSWLAEARRTAHHPPRDTEVLRQLRRVLAWMSPLNLLHPADPSFVAGNCRTFHDITRFAHQRSLQEMLERATGLGGKEYVGYRLRSDIPLRVNLLYLDQAPPQSRRRQWLTEEEIESKPMKAFWAGVTAEGWPTPPADFRGFLSVVGAHVTGLGKPEYSEDSYAVVSRDYMIASLRMGYHFNTVEAMCSDEPNKNFIRIQYKQGGASLERRLRRLKLITSVLSDLGFENARKGDFLDSRIAYLPEEAVLSRLRLVGRLSILTKQLDMALSNDSVAEWYTEDIKKKLGLSEESKRVE